MELALEWKPRWKGTGQFAAFPYAAANELYVRLLPDAVAPTKAAQALLEVVGAGLRSLDGKEADLPAALTAMEALLPKLPAPGERRERFIAEMVAALGDELMRVFDVSAETLAAKGHVDLAHRFVAIEEALFPVRAGSSRAMVRAAQGDAEGAAADLRAIADDSARDDFARLAAVDGLIELGKLDDAKRVTLAIVDRAQATKDLELGTEVVERLTHLLKADPKLADRQALRARVEALAAALQPEGEGA